MHKIIFIKSKYQLSTVGNLAKAACRLRATENERTSLVLGDSGE